MRIIVAVLVCLTSFACAAGLPEEFQRPTVATELAEVAALEHNEVSIVFRLRQWEMRYRGPEIVRGGSKVHVDIEFTNRAQIGAALLLWGNQPYSLSATTVGMRFETGMPADGDTFVYVEPGETIRHRIDLTKLYAGRVLFGNIPGLYEVSVAVHTGENIVQDFPNRLQSTGAIKAPLQIMEAQRYDQLVELERRQKVMRKE